MEEETKLTSISREKQNDFFSNTTVCSIWIMAILKRYCCGFDFGVGQLSLSFLLWKNVYILKTGIKNLLNFSNDCAQFSKFPPYENLEYSPNHKG